MKAALAIFALVLGLLIIEKSWGNEPADKRECRIAGGIYWAVSVNSTFDTPLCRFGSSVIGAMDFAEYKWTRKTTQAMGAYAFAQEKPISDSICADAGARLVTAGDSNRDFWRICVFPDNSIIGADTLAQGPRNVNNGALTAALGL